MVWESPHQVNGKLSRWVRQGILARLPRFARTFNRDRRERASGGVIALKTRSLRSRSNVPELPARRKTQGLPKTVATCQGWCKTIFADVPFATGGSDRKQGRWREPHHAMALFCPRKSVAQP